MKRRILRFLPKYLPLANEEISILESVTVEQNVVVHSVISPSAPRVRSSGADIRRDLVRLAAWVCGLESFLSGGSVLLGDRTTIASFEDHIRELRIARSGLQASSRIVFRLLASNDAPVLDKTLREAGISTLELQGLAVSLRTPLLLAETLDHSQVLNAVEWQAWCKAFFDSLNDAPAFAKLVALSDAGGEMYLPVLLTDLLSIGVSTVEREELAAILPRFGRILSLLEIIGDMLERDEPLKPALLLFSKISQQTQELIGYINNLIEHSTSADEDFIGALDGASYTASIELKKVLNQELVGMISVRPATMVYARTEAAHALLTESFQHILTGFAKHFDPALDAFALFPDFGVKLERSRTLRNELYSILRLVQAAEKEADKANIKRLNDALVKYVDEALGYLFYKDTETFERFVEEILVTRQKKDLVPILHRFGAYLETLFAQVNMRAVLEGHPFQQRDA